EHDEYTAASERTLSSEGITAERMSLADLQRRFPQIGLENVGWALFEPEAGVLMARRAVAAVVEDAVRSGVEYRAVAVGDPLPASGAVESIRLTTGERISAAAFVFCCGPWLPKIFPQLLGPRMFITRQEVLFFGTPPGDDRFREPAMPAWLHHGDQIYGMPD